MKVVINKREDDLSKSIINGTPVSEFPEALRDKMLDLLGKLEGVKNISEFEEGRPTIELPDKNVGIGYLAKEIRDQYLKLMALLRWYLKPHWYGMGRRGAIGGTTYCNDCGTGEIVGSGSGYCGNPDCPSHEKWKEVIGDSYQLPSRPVLSSFPKIKLQ